MSRDTRAEGRRRKTKWDGALRCQEDQRPNIEDRRQQTGEQEAGRQEDRETRDRGRQEPAM